MGLPAVAHEEETSLGASAAMKDVPASRIEPGATGVTGTTTHPSGWSITYNRPGAGRGPRRDRDGGQRGRT